MRFSFPPSSSWRSTGGGADGSAGSSPPALGPSTSTEFSDNVLYPLSPICDAFCFLYKHQKTEIAMAKQATNVPSTLPTAPVNWASVRSPISLTFTVFLLLESTCRPRMSPLQLLSSTRAVTSRYTPSGYLLLRRVIPAAMSAVWTRTAGLSDESGQEPL